MTTIERQPGERDFATDLLGGIVAGLTLGLVDLTGDEAEPQAPTTGRTGPCLVPRVDEDREIGG